MKIIDWENQWYSNMASMNEISSVAYWNKRAEDYDDFIRTSRFSYGKKIVDILFEAGVANDVAHVFEIAGGVGALTLPLSQRTAMVTTVEPAIKMADKLLRNVREQGVDNVEIIVATGEDVAARGLSKSYDLAIMCHATWQFPDLRWLIRFMEKAGAGRVCIADSVPMDESAHTRIYQELGVSHQSFDRVDALYNVLCSLGRKPQSLFFPFTMRRSVASAMTMMTQVVRKYRKPDEHDLQLIEQHVAAHACNGTYTEPARMGVVWWQQECMTQ